MTARASDRQATRLLVIDPARRRMRDADSGDLPRLLRAGDVVVLNDAATLPASLSAQSERGEALELRLLGPMLDERTEAFRALVLGAGDFRLRTEDRPAPPTLPIGAIVQVGPELRARVTGHAPYSERIVELQFEKSGSALWIALYAWGKPIQYSYQHVPLPLWSVQTAYAARPWAAEMPSAGRPLSLRMLLRLQSQGVNLVTLTHAAGISSTGDPALDRLLPFPERYRIPERTRATLERARTDGRRVIAVGTSVVRALESSAADGGGQIAAGDAVSELHIDAHFQPRVVTGLLTGIHVPGESHYALLRAFVDAALLEASSRHAREHGYREHEFGDASLVLPHALASVKAQPEPSPLTGAATSACRARVDTSTL